MTGYLDRAYQLHNSKQTLDLYDDWASSYDQELLDNGYVTPERVAAALKACCSNTDANVLDIGCGSGLSGIFLAQQGFSTLYGSDYSAAMLKQAEAKGIYQQLFLVNDDNAFTLDNISFHVAAAAGVLSPGHAEAAMISDVIERLEPNGLFGFSLNDHSLEDPSYMAAIDTLLKNRQARIRWQEYGDHIRKRGLNAMILVLEKAA